MNSPIRLLMIVLIQDVLFRGGVLADPGEELADGDKFVALLPQIGKDLGEDGGGDAVAVQQRDGTAEIIDIYNVIVDQMIGFIRAIVGNSKGVVFPINILHNKVGGRGGEVAILTMHSSNMVIAQIFTYQFAATFGTVDNILHIGVYCGLGLISLYAKVYAAFVLRTKR